MELTERIRRHAATQPRQRALEWSGGQLDYAGLSTEIDHLATILRSAGWRTLAVAMDNGPAWALLDLAALEAGLCLVPLPPFFSDAQLRHVLARSGAQALFTDQPDLLGGRLDLDDAPGRVWTVAGKAVIRLPLQGDSGAVPEGVSKLTFTSGTTGEPKGVMLGWRHMGPVVRSVAAALAVRPEDRHLALSPLCVLLENVAGLYTALWAGATAVLPGCSEVGLSGSSSLDVARMHAVLEDARATTATFSPHSLQGLVEALESGLPKPPLLRFAAVGGAPVSPRLLLRAATLGLPVFEGYGLSECASVVCLSTPGHNRPGSVGRPLPHVRLRLAADGELLIAGPGFAGYLGEQAPDGKDWTSGDLARLDADGYLHLQGRKRNVFITAFGRNVAPEWVERELTLEPAIAQAAVFGEGRPWNAAVVFPAPGAGAEALNAAIAQTNAELPDYARIGAWIAAGAPFSPTNALATGTGRIRHGAVYARYRTEIESLYRGRKPL